MTQYLTDVTAVSSKGQIVLPKPIRDSLSLEAVQGVESFTVPESITLYPDETAAIEITDILPEIAAGRPFRFESADEMVVKVEDGVAKLNFTGEFVNLVQNSDGGRMALKALVLTCTQFEGVKSVEIYVDGQPYDAAQGELGVPSFMNIADSIVYDYIQTQSNALFDYE